MLICIVKTYSLQCANLFWEFGTYILIDNLYADKYFIEQIKWFIILFCHC